MNIIFLTGLTACGKSEIAENEGRELGMPVVSLSDVYHSVAERFGFEHIREMVDVRGIPFSLDQGRNALAEAVNETRRENGVIVDDLFDFHTMAYIRDRFDLAVFETYADTHEPLVLVVHVDARESARIERHAKWMRSDIEEARKWVGYWDALRERAGIRAAMRAADVIIDNNRPLFEVLREVHAELGARLKQIRGGVERS